MSGAFDGVRVVEFAGIGPAPFCAMLLADHGADVVRIDRAGAMPLDPVTARGRSSVVLDLKSPGGAALALAAMDRADVAIEGFRPGVMERLGLGPDVALARNPRLIYGRMTGWGQTGPLAHSAGHDLTYIALTGVLAALGPADAPPPPPLNLVGDFGGGALYLAFGIAAALYERERSGRGQVIDAAVVDGTASLMALFSGRVASGRGTLERGRSELGGGAPNYRCYECADGRYVAVAPREPQFRAALYALLGIDPPHAASWDDESRALADVFKRKPRDEWVALFEGTDACVAPVLTLDEAPAHPQMRARDVYYEAGGVVQPAPAPRFSRTPGTPKPAPCRSGEGGRDTLQRWGVDVPARSPA